uniref:Uncharacterized protein n=1 Tax=Caenorhabditis japonica TaxID=281687 RepID=A0A8R1IJW0_CAEJA
MTNASVVATLAGRRRECIGLPRGFFRRTDDK